MEKLFQIKSNFLKFLSKQPAAIVTFQNPKVSPCRSPAHVVSIVPREARRKHRGESFKEPTSPKVSCMGQVQDKKKRKARKQKRDRAQAQQAPTKNIDSVRCKKILLWIPKGSDEERKPKVLEEKGMATVEAPSLSTMKKFASGRGSLYDFHKGECHTFIRPMQD
ncbi:hypothetical protein CR513_21885, partial [Mucuna pruriens]